MKKSLIILLIIAVLGFITFQLIYKKTGTPKGPAIQTLPTVPPNIHDAALLLTSGTVTAVEPNAITIHTSRQNYLQGIPASVTGLITKETKFFHKVKNKDGSFTQSPAAASDIHTNDLIWFFRAPGDNNNPSRFKVSEVDLIIINAR